MSLSTTPGRVRPPVPEPPWLGQADHGQLRGRCRHRKKLGRSSPAAVAAVEAGGGPFHDAVAAAARFVGIAGWWSFFGGEEVVGSRAMVREEGGDATLGDQKKSWGNVVGMMMLKFKIDH